MLWIRWSPLLAWTWIVSGWIIGWFVFVLLSLQKQINWTWASIASFLFWILLNCLLFGWKWMIWSPLLAWTWIVSGTIIGWFVFILLSLQIQINWTRASIASFCFEFSFVFIRLEVDDLISLVGLDLDSLWAMYWIVCFRPSFPPKRN